VSVTADPIGACRIQGNQQNIDGLAGSPPDPTSDEDHRQTDEDGPETPRASGQWRMGCSAHDHFDFKSKSFVPPLSGTVATSIDFCESEYSGFSDSLPGCGILLTGSMGFPSAVVHRLMRTR